MRGRNFPELLRSFLKILSFPGSCLARDRVAPEEIGKLWREEPPLILLSLPPLRLLCCCTGSHCCTCRSCLAFFRPSTPWTFESGLVGILRWPFLVSPLACLRFPCLVSCRLMGVGGILCFFLCTSLLACFRSSARDLAFLLVSLSPILARDARPLSWSPEDTLSLAFGVFVWTLLATPLRFVLATSFRILLALMSAFWFATSWFRLILLTTF